MREMPAQLHRCLWLQELQMSVEDAEGFDPTGPWLAAPVVFPSRVQCVAPHPF